MNLRRLLAEAMVGVGVHRLARRGVSGAILMLHRVRQESDRRWLADPGLWVTDRHLATLIRALKRQGYAIVPLDQALDRLAQPDGRPFVCLTFDDGYGDFHDIALPVLAAEQVPAALYVTSGFVDRAAPLWEVGLEALVARGGALVADWGEGERRLDLTTDDGKRAAYGLLCRALRALPPAHRATVLQDLSERTGLDFIAETDRAVITWTRLEALAGSPWVTIGGHTRSHPALSLLPEAAVAEEMISDRSRLEQRLGLAVRHFAYPYGDRQAVAAQTIATAARQGFASATLAYGGPLRTGDGAFALPRIGIGGNDSVAAILLRMAGIGRAAQPTHRAALAL